MADSSGAGTGKRSGIGRFLPVLVLGLGLAAFFALGLQRYVTLDALKANRAWLQAWVAANPLLAAASFGGAYALIVACSIPVGAVMTLAAGFLFGVVKGTAIVVLSATLGATIIFAAAKTALADLIRRRFGASFAKMEDGFRANAFSYVLFLRLIPIFPFFLVNLGAGVLGVPTFTYVAATLIGIIPGTAVYAGLGNGLGTLFDKNVEPDLHLLTKPAILYPLIGLALLALLPVAWRTLRGSSKKAKS